MIDETSVSWRCSVCGYVHGRVNVPDFCPVCGAPASEFEVFGEAVAFDRSAGPEKWQCLNCNYVHTGSEPPDICPLCGAFRDRFDALKETSTASESHGVPRNVVIIGAGIAGVSAAEAVRRYSPDSVITLISREERLPYYRLNLTRYLAGEVSMDAMPVHGIPWYEENHIDLLVGVEVVDVVPGAHSVKMRDGSSINYDALIMSLGSHPFVPSFPGSNLENVFVLRTSDDAVQIMERCARKQKCVVIGGGVLGLEAASALARSGGDITLLEAHEWIMPRQLNRRAGVIMADKIADIGIKLIKEARTAEIVGDEAVAGVLLQDGRLVDADYVIIATGVRPNSFLARRAGLEVNNGVVVNNHLQTSEEHIFAAGDVAEHNGVVYGAWAASQYQGTIAGMNSVGAGVMFGGLPRSSTLKVLDVDLVSIGQIESGDGSYIIIETEENNDYSRFVFHDNNMVGALLLGDARYGSAAKKAIEERKDFSRLLAARKAEVSDILAILQEKVV